MAEADITSTVFKLEIENELRILVGEQSSSIELQSGLAEIYGTEMVINKEYTFPPHSSVAVYTWHGCSVKVTGKTEDAHIETDTRMILNVILNANLEERRIKAESKNVKGPTVLVVGPIDVGKSTLCRILLNYASRLGRRPIFVDLDVGQNSISVPGSLGILNIENPADIIQGFEDRAAQVYHFGYKSPGHNIALYFLLLKQLGKVVQSGLRHASRCVRASGVIINSCGWVRGHGYDAITLAAMAFEIDDLYVLGEERLYSQLTQDMPSSVKVHYIPRLDGVKERTRVLRSKIRDLRVREYFFGPANNIRPYSFDIDFFEFKVFKVNSLPVGDDFDSKNVSLNCINLQPVTLNLQLVNQVLGLSSAEKVADDIILTDVVGFICIQHVDIGRGKLKVLSPQPSPIPTKILFIGDIRLTGQLGNFTEMSTLGLSF